MHTHPHASAGGVSGGFPTYALALAARVVTDTSRIVQDVRTPSDVLLSSTPEPLINLNRFLNFVTPGAAALQTQLDRLPPDTFQVNQFNDASLVWLMPAFFTRSATETVARIAIRSLVTAGTLLRSSREVDMLPRTFAAWLDRTPTPSQSETVELTTQDFDWVLKSMLQLPAAPKAPIDVADLPSEAQAEELTRFLLAKRDEGEKQRFVMTAR